MSGRDDTPLRVAQVMGKLVSGGVESVVFNYYRHIDRRKIQFDFYYDADSTSPPPEDVAAMGTRFIQVPPYQNLPAYLGGLTRHFKENRYQIVHAHLNTLSVFPLCAAWMAGVPVRVCHNHSTAGKGETVKNILKYTLRPFAKVFATDYCACSYHAGKWLFGKPAMERGKVTVFRNAIDLERFQYDPLTREAVRRELELEGKLVLGHVGRFCYQKNHAFLVDIFAEVHRRRPEAVLLLAGNGALMEAVRQKVRELELEHSVRFLGVRTDVERLYQAMDVFVLPSRYEGLGIVSVEAQATGLPCVCSDEVPAEVQLSAGLRFLPLDAPPARWADVVLEAVGQERMNAMETIRAAGFDIRRVAGELESFYRQYDFRQEAGAE